MSTHYNVQIHVQRVTAAEHQGTGRGDDRRDRNVTEVLDVKVVADSEAEAYAKIKRIIAAHAISADEYDALLEEQGGRCAICRREPGVASLAVYHDHACCPGKGKSCGKCIRGLLCEDCNRGIGMLNDDVQILGAAIRYLS